MKNKVIIIIIVLSVITSSLLADGLLMPTNESYPNDFLRNKVTEVTVTINGLIAETVVYQEFINEWDQAVDAVYSFPLPENARSTKLKYMRNDTTFVAVLKVQQQSTNPGTGEGGTAALVNSYIGSNGLKLALKGIPGGETQKIELHYISVLDYHQGQCRYEYPLNTEDFVFHPIDHLEFNITVNSSKDIVSFNIPSHSDYEIMLNDPKKIIARLRKPMAFLASDFVLNYSIDDLEMDVDFFSCINDSLGGHFALFIRPECSVDTSRILSKNIVFLLGNSSNMVGYKLNQSIASITSAIDSLDMDDYFNIILFNSSTSVWQNNLVQATPENINNAKVYLEGVTGRYGSRMDLGINRAFEQFQSDEYSNSIIAFTDGYSTLDPKQIALNNTYKIGIFPIGIGDDIDRSRLEMTAELNYGFVTYFDEDDNLKEGINEVFEKINKPVLKGTELHFNKVDISKIIPQKYPTTFAGSYFFVTGKYQTQGASVINLKGMGVSDSLQYNYQVDFLDSSAQYTAPKYIWAKEMIDAIENEIAIYGETDALKDSVIDISLTYNMRCKYTAYIADYSTIDDDWGTKISDDESIFPESFILSCYPNPFNPTTTIRFYLDASAIAKVKFLKIYNTLGQLVNVIDISTMSSGWHEIRFNGKDFYGKPLPGGVYIIALEVDNIFVNTMKINLLK